MGLLQGVVDISLGNGGKTVGGGGGKDLVLSEHCIIIE